MKRLLTIIFVLLMAISLIFVVTHGSQLFSRKTVRQTQRTIRSYGVLGPIIVFALIVLSTLIPPLPLPIPLIELAAGIAFGFLPGFLIVWLSQIVSSVAAFWLARVMGKRFFPGVMHTKIAKLYERYLDKKGPIAVFISRAAFASPMNVTSFLAGMTHMELRGFVVATLLGTIPEAVLFPLVGATLRQTHLSLLTLSTFVICLGIVGTTVMFFYLKRTSKSG